MKIGEIANRTGIPVDTIRYYEKVGLLHAPLRNNNGYRSYNSAHLERLLFIRRCRSLDMSQNEIRQLIQLGAEQEADCSDVDALVAHHLQHVRQRLQELAQLEETLVQLQAACTSGKTIRECGILAGLHSDLEVADNETNSHVPGIHGANQDKR